MSLHPDFVKAFKTHLPELFQIWVSIDPIDRRPVVEPIAQKAYRVSSERFRGEYTLSACRARFEQSDAYRNLGEAISKYQYELTQRLVIPGRIVFQNEPFFLAGSWCMFLQENGVNENNPADRGMDKLLVLLEQTLKTRTVTEFTRTAFAGIYLPSSRSSIELSPNARLRQISAQERADFESEEDVNFFMSGNSYAPPSLVGTCLDLSRAYQFYLDSAEIKDSFPQALSAKEVSATSVLRALHVLKHLMASSRFENIEWHPKILTNCRRLRVWPRLGSIDVRGRWTSMKSTHSSRSKKGFANRLARNFAWRPIVWSRQSTAPHGSTPSWMPSLAWKSCSSQPTLTNSISEWL